MRGLATENHVDFSQGELSRTGRALDLALDGEGFFAIDTPDGEVYTREGSFRLTPDGTLVSEEGLPVAWDSLSGSIDPTGFPVEVDGEGTVRQGVDEIGRLRIANFADSSRLSLNADGYWQAPPRLAEAAHSATVHQGALEDSNASGVEELVAMISVQRSFESVARVMSKIEDSYSRLTRPF